MGQNVENFKGCEYLYLYIIFEMLKQLKNKTPNLDVSTNLNTDLW